LPLSGCFHILIYPAIHLLRKEQVRSSPSSCTFLAMPIAATSQSK
jgi:hypothetical protein